MVCRCYFLLFSIKKCVSKVGWLQHNTLDIDSLNVLTLTMKQTPICRSRRIVCEKAFINKLDGQILRLNPDLNRIKDLFSPKLIAFAVYCLLQLPSIPCFSLIYCPTG